MIGIWRVTSPAFSGFVLAQALNPAARGVRLDGQRQGRLLITRWAWAIALSLFSANTASAFVLSPPAADLSVTKTAFPPSLSIGQTLTYTVTVTNNGPNPAANITMTDLLPATTTFQSITPPAGWTCPTTPPVNGTGTVICSVAALAAASPAVFTIVVNTVVGWTLINGAFVNSSSTLTQDPNTTNNLATASATVSGPGCKPAAKPIPTLGEWARIMLVLVLVVGGWLQLRRRARVTG